MKKGALKKGEKVLFEQCKIATNFFNRFMGLMGKTRLSHTEAIVFPKCNSIHTFFMLMPIDVLFVSGEGRVEEIKTELTPWKMVMPVKNAKHTVEMQANLAEKLGLKVGDSLSLEGVF